MKKDKILILIIIIFIVNIGRLKATGIPVWDSLNFAKAAYQSAEKIKKWIDYIKKFDEYRKFFDTYKARFENTIRKFKQGEIDELFGGVDIEVLLKIVESTAYNDSKDLDEWRKLFKNADLLYTKYPDIKDYKFITETPVYKKNKSVQEYLNIEIKRNNDQLQDYQKIMNDLNEIRKMETELITKKYKGYREKIEEFNSDDMSPNLLRAYVLINLIDMEILKLNYSMMIILRTYFEMDIKDSVNEMDSVMTEELYKENK